MGIAPALPATTANIGRSPKIDPITHDYVVLNGQLQFVSNADGNLEYYGQLLKSRLLLFEGEYFPNVNEGMAWFQSILIKGYSPNIVQGLFSDRILGTPGFLSLSNLQLTFDNEHRTLTVDFTAQTDEGLLTDQFLLPLTPPAQAAG